MKAVRPPICWRQDPSTWPNPAPGYERQVVGSGQAKLLAWLWGVEPVHVGQCEYVLDVPAGLLFDPAGPAAQEAKAWLAKGNDKQAVADFLKLMEKFGSACYIPRPALERALSRMSPAPLPAIADTQRRANLDAFATVVWHLLLEKD